MAFKFIILSAFLAAANAGYLGAPAAVGYASPYAYSAPSAYAHGIASPAIVSQQNNILRTPGNLGQVSTYSKTISTPYSSVSKYDTRVSNDALAYPHSYAAPAYAHAAYAAPAYAHAAYAPAVAKVAAPVAYSAPAYAHAAYPAVAAHHAYASPAIGVAYSAAPAVSHITYSNGLGLNYAY